jgi:RNA polymerase sigma-70 factor (ECF subfamily)
MLQTLPEDQRTALLLREQEQLRYKEIGSVLNISESKVKVVIVRARAALRERWNRVAGLPQFTEAVATTQVNSAKS